MTDEAVIELRNLRQEFATLIANLSLALCGEHSESATSNLLYDTRKNT